MPRDHPFLPFLVALAAVALFSLMDALMKGASIAAGAYSALLLRSGFALVVIVPAWLAQRVRTNTRGWPPRAAMRIHVIRGVVASAMAVSFFWGLARVPMAEAIALSFIAPLVALYLAALVLGESIRGRAVGASLMGLAGVAVIVLGRAGSQAAGAGHEEALWGTASILLSSMLYAWNLVLQRQQSQLAGPVEVAAFQTVMIGAVLVLFAPFLFELPPRAAWPAIGGSALLALGAQMLFAWAYARAEAQALVPVEYSGFLWAALFGWLFFAEGLELPVLLGAILIVAGCWIAAPRRHTEQTAL
jgi:S-adenosylmethionine uptake transporter